jgi:hypothetical protein
VARDLLEMRRERSEPQPAGVTAVRYDEALQRVGDIAGADLLAALREPELAAVEAEVSERLAGRPDGPFPPDFNSSLALARTAWAAVRASRATRVLETGVAAGFSTCFILAALERNGGGELHSVDVPPEGVDPEQVGWLVPERHRGAWRLYRERSRRALPRIFRAAEQPFEVFLHDGLHTKPTMRFELDCAARALAPGGLVLADDAERHAAFAEWAAATKPRVWSLVQTEYPGHEFGLAAL